MSKEIVEVVHGKHLRYEVIRNRTFFCTNYTVRSSDGRTSGTFDRLDRAVQWAYQCAQSR